MKFISPLRFFSALFSVACFSTPQLQADVTYRLVTDNDMLMDRCVYLVVAEDVDIAAANELASPTGIKTTVLTRDGNIIRQPSDNIGEFILRYTAKCDPECFGPSAHADFNWGFQIKLPDTTPYMAFDFNKQGLVRDGAPATIGTTSNKKQYRIYHYISKLSVSENNTLESAYYADTNPCGQLFMEEIQNGYVLNVSNNGDSNNKRHNIQLYRKDVFGISVTEITKDDSGSFKIKLHFNTYDKDHPNYAGFLFYAFSDEEQMSNDDIYDGSTSEQRINRHSAEELEIAYTGNKKYLWLVKEHTLNNSLETDVIKVEIKETPLPVTSAEAGHFTHPATDGYAIGNYIDFEPKDSDVKIYYTLDGRDPIIPGSTPAALSDISDETEDHAGKTYDLDERPLIYEGSPLSVRYIAVKTGHSPSVVGSVSIPGIPTAINIIGSDNTPAKTIYYNMQGLRVCQPLSPGLYIRRQGCKTEKIIVR